MSARSPMAASRWPALFFILGLFVPCAHAQNAAALDVYLQKRAHETSFNGAVLVQQRGITLLRAAYGMAEHELQVPLSPDHIFRIGSLTKPITATGILLLVDQGKLSLSDPVCTFLESCPASWEPVTVHHLLTHTSGIPDLFGNLPDAPVRETRAEIERLLTSRNDIPLRSVPGAMYQYSNFNYMLLGYITEIVAEQFWENFLMAQVFDPLGMRNTRYDDVWTLVPERARGYAFRNNRLEHAEYEDHSAYAAGGLRSTVDDLATWHAAYWEERLLSDTLRTAALQPYAGQYGYGWQILTLFDRSMHNHSGGIGGFSSHLAYYPSEDLRIIVLSNVEGENAKGTACDLAALLFDATPPPQTNRNWLAQPTPHRCHQK